MTNYKLSNTAINLLKKSEGFSANPYADGYGFTWGYGHQIIGDIPFGMVGIGIDDATELLKQDLQARLDAFNSVNTNTDLSENQIAAILDFSFSTSPQGLKNSDIINYINSKDYTGLYNWLQNHYITSKGVPNAVLKQRRLNEIALFQSDVTTKSSLVKWILIIIIAIGFIWWILTRLKKV